jgi:uncharacterized membrane protein
MKLPTPTLELTEARRAGLLAAVSVYPVTRLAGTLPRPAVDRAIVSGATMAFVYAAASATTGAVRKAVVPGVRTELERDRRTALATGALAVGAGAVAWQARRRARAAAAAGERLPIPVAASGAVAEVVAVSAAAGAVVSAADVVGVRLPEVLRPRDPVVVVTSILVAGGALAAASRHPRVLSYFLLPSAEGSTARDLTFQSGASLPIAVGRAAAVAGAALAVLGLESAAAGALARGLDGHEPPRILARFAGHGVIVLGLGAVGLAGFGFYSSRVAVQESLLEAAYAAVPNRVGVTGGPGSAYSFEDLGREGRRFVSQAHTFEELEAVLGGPASDPVRAFVPLSALTGDPETDAATVVDEVDRVGGFAKSTIVLAAPTGDGYVSYVQTETVEMLTAGDCATVAVPYAAVPSAVAFPRRRRAAVSYAAYARAIATRAREQGHEIRLCAFGESLGSIVALDAFGPDVVSELQALGFAGGLYVGVPIFSEADRALRPAHPGTRLARGLQYATGRDQALDSAPGHLNLTHPTDPVGIADPSVIVRHPVDYWGRPTGLFVPLVSFLIELADVKNAMNLRPGEFTPSPGHDYRYDTAAAVARAYDLPFDQEEVVEHALRERELAWSVRRLLSRRIGEARDAALGQLRSWGVDPATIGERFAAQRSTLAGWIDSARRTDDDTGSADDDSTGEPVEGSTDSTTHAG